MKKVFATLIVSFAASSLHSQSVGIGTNSPDPKAALQIKSTTQGILIPSMSTSQRFKIIDPPNGLLVYDTDKNEFHQYNGAAWSAILNGNYWSRPITNRKKITNTNDSIGLGTVAPTELLDVAGNIRSRNNIKADAVLQGQTLIASGNIIAGGTGVFNSDLSSNAMMVINNDAAILQLRSSGIDKGFVQLNGDDLRVGTNIGNNDGKIIFRSGGVDRLTIFKNGNIAIGTTSSTTDKLRIAGNLSVQDTLKIQDDIVVGGKVKSNFSGNKNMLPLCHGYVSKDGVLLSGTDNVSITTTTYNGNTLKKYLINCAGITSSSILMVSAKGIDGNTDPEEKESLCYNAVAQYESPGVALVTTWVHYMSLNGDYRGTSVAEGAFYFVIYE